MGFEGAERPGKSGALAERCFLLAGSRLSDVVVAVAFFVVREGSD